MTSRAVRYAALALFSVITTLVLAVVCVIGASLFVAGGFGFGSEAFVVLGGAFLVGLGFTIYLARRLTLPVVRMCIREVRGL
jgi:hypothetical protein